MFKKYLTHFRKKYNLLYRLEFSTVISLFVYIQCTYFNKKVGFLMVFCFIKLPEFDINFIRKAQDFSVLKINTVAEFSVSICNTPKFICSSDGGVSIEGVPRLLNTRNDASYKSNTYKNECVHHVILKSNL